MTSSDKFCATSVPVYQYSNADLVNTITDLLMVVMMLMDLLSDSTPSAICSDFLLANLDLQIDLTMEMIWVNNLRYILSWIGYRIGGHVFVQH